MLAIRMQRTGRSGHAQFRVIVQDSRFHPTRGKVVAYLGSYDPHTKVVQIDKETAKKYLNNGAQPSDRVARLLKTEGVKLPDWVKLDVPKKRAIRHPEKLRRNRPAGEAAAPAEPAEPTEAAAEPGEGETVAEQSAEQPAGTSAEEQPNQQMPAEGSPSANPQPEELETAGQDEAPGKKPEPKA